MNRTLRLSLFLAAGLGASVAVAAAAQSVEPLWFAPAKSARPAEAPPLRLASRPGLPPLAHLDEAAADEGSAMAKIAAWNRASRQPAKNGFARPLPEVARIELDAALPAPAAGSAVAHAGGLLAKSTAGDLVWGAAVRVEGAYRLRLELSKVRLPPSARLWIYADSGETVGPFGIEALSPGADGAGGSLWTPSVAGPGARLEVAIPGEALGAAGEPWGFQLGTVMEILPVGRSDDRAAAADGVSAVATKLGECVVDATCASTIPLDTNTLALVGRATAALQFVSAGESFLCSGGLITDVARSGTPLLWTANHCISQPGEAASLEAFWDYVSLGCQGPPPALGSLERSFSSTLLATGAASDFTLLELNDLPPGRVFFGWTAEPAATLPGVEVHRLSHPLGEPQRYSRSTISGSPRICFGAPEPQNLYHTTNMGGTFGGSSGAPLFLANGQIVGQLSGGCPQAGGSDPFDGCDYDNAEVDGAFAVSFDSVAQFLAGAPTIPCANTDTELCLNQDRFKVDVSWKTRTGAEGTGKVVPFRSDNSGLYYFFKSTNWEMLIKVLNGCPVNGRYWVFFAATTNVEFTVNVSDSQTGRAKQYFNPLGQSADAVTDTEAFAVCP